VTSRVEWKNEQSLEARALYALWRNHPLTAVKDRGGERAHRMARANRDMLLSWAAAQPDYRLRDCRNIGAATLAWIRANQSPTPTGLNVDDLTRFIDDALEDWSTRPDPEPSAQVAVYLARRIAENIVTPPPAGRDAVRMRGLFGGETEARATEWVLRIEAEARAPLLAELRAQAFGEPRCVPLSIIERIFADPEAEVRAVSAPPPLDAGLREALRRQHLEETHNASGSCPGWGCPTARALAALEEPTP
jgi:hypothetical protein